MDMPKATTSLVAVDVSSGDNNKPLTGTIEPPSARNPAAFFKGPVPGPAPTYPTPEELQRAIAGYFDTLFDGMKWIGVPSLRGCGLHLGFNSASWHERYSSKPEFRPVIERLRTVIKECIQHNAVYPPEGANPYMTGAMLKQQWTYELAEAGLSPDQVQQDDRATPEDVKRVIASLKIEKPSRYKDRGES